MEARPVADLYQIVAGEVRLRAGRRRDDGALVFPCPTGAAAPDHEPVLLPATGTLWSWTVQRFAPKAPYDGPSGDDYQPYGVAYVQLGDALIVEGRIAATPPPPLTIGQAMQVVRVIYTRDAHGQPIETYAFAPLERSP